MFALAKDLINGILNRARGSKRKTSTDSSSASTGDEPLGQTLNSEADSVSEVFSSEEDILAETIDQVADGVSGFSRETLDETVDAVDTSILNGSVPKTAEELEIGDHVKPPCVPPSKSQDVTPPSTAAPASTYGGKTEDELLSRPIPPRRSKRMEQPVEVQGDVSSIFHTGDNSDEIIVISDEDIDSAYVAKAAYADTSNDQELTQLRLALEASQNELSHLTASRDQALSSVAKHESQVEHLQRRIEESESQSTAWHQERHSLTDLVSELQGDASRLQTELNAVSEQCATTEQKLAESTSEEAVQQIEAQHKSTVDELRSILGQREAAEASLLRERDSLGEVNSELQRKIDDLHAELATATASGDMAETTSARTGESDSFAAEATEAMARIGVLEMQQQQASAELSLANETIRQLNQNLAQRDAELINLRHEHEATKSELSALQELTAEQPPNIDQEEAEASRDRALADLEESEAALESKKQELDTAKQELEAARHAVHTAKEEMVAAKESESALQATLQAIQGKQDTEREELNAVHNNLSAELDVERSKVSEFESLRDQLDDDVVKASDAIRSERDQAATAAAEASATIARLMSELHALKAIAAGKESAIEKLKEENHEYRSSVSELHAVANEVDELKLDRAREQQTARQRLHEATTANAELSAELASIRRQPTDVDLPETNVDPKMAEEWAAIRNKANELQRENDTKKKEVADLQAQIDATPNDRKEAAKTTREGKRLSSALGESEKKLLERDARLEDLAIKLSKSRVELASLRSELTEQKAVVRALNRGGEPSTDHLAVEENGRAKKTVRPKKSPRRKSSTRSPAKGISKTKAKRVRKTTESAETKSSSLIGQTNRDAKLGQVFTSRPSQIDNLKKIHGVGPVLEKRLNAAGIYQFKQVTSWTKSIVDYLDEHLALGGRISRDNWVDQARKLSKKG